MPWYKDKDSCDYLAGKLVEAGLLGVRRSPDLAVQEVLAFYSKPWKWEAEWRHLQVHGTLDNFAEAMNA